MIAFRSLHRFAIYCRTSSGLFLFSMFFALYLMFISGIFLGTADIWMMFGVTDNLVLHGSWEISPRVVQLAGMEPDHLRKLYDRLYQYKGMSYSVLLVPFYVVGRMTALVTNMEEHDLLISMLAASIAGPWLGALHCVLVYQSTMVFGFDRRIATLTALVTGLGTIIWADSKSNMSEPLLGLTITGAYLGLAHLRRRPTAGWAAFTGGCLSVLFLSQPAMLLLVVPVVTAYLLWGGWRAWRTERRQAAVAVGAYGLALLVGLGLLGWLNWLRYGALVSADYQGAMQPGLAIPVYIGIYGLLFSAGKSIFLYSPPLVCALAAAPAFCRRVGILGTLPLALLGVFLVAYGGLAYWHGDGAWGPRYLIPLTGVLVVMVAEWIAEARTIAKQLALWSFTVFGAIVQLIGVLTNTSGYFNLLLQHQVLLSGDTYAKAWNIVLFDPQFSPVVGRGMLLLSSLHRMFVGESITWIVWMNSESSWRSIPLAGWDSIDWWPVWLTTFGAATPDLRFILLVTGIEFLCCAVAAISAWNIWRVTRNNAAYTN